MPRLGDLESGELGSPFRHRSAKNSCLDRGGEQDEFVIEFIRLAEVEARKMTNADSSSSRRSPSQSRLVFLLLTVRKPDLSVQPQQQRHGIKLSSANT